MRTESIVYGGYYISEVRSVEKLGMKMESTDEIVS